MHKAIGRGLDKWSVSFPKPRPEQRPLEGVSSLKCIVLFLCVRVVCVYVCVCVLFHEADLYANSSPLPTRFLVPWADGRTMRALPQFPPY
jgi:hypothetical protein